MPESLRVVTAPAELPVTLVLAKLHLRVDHAADDDLITAMLKGAAADCSVESGQGVGVGTYAVTLDEFPAGCDAEDLVVRLPVRPVASVTSVAYRDADDEAQTLDAEEYYVGAQTGRLMPVEGWPATREGRPEAVTVTFTAGTAAASLPHQVIAAVLIILADRYQNRGEEVSASHSQRPVPPAARRLLAQVSQGEYC